MKKKIVVPAVVDIDYAVMLADLMRGSSGSSKEELSNGTWIPVLEDAHTAFNVAKLALAEIRRNVAKFAPGLADTFPAEVLTSESANGIGYRPNLQLTLPQWNFAFQGRVGFEYAGDASGSINPRRACPKGLSVKGNKGNVFVTTGGYRATAFDADRNLLVWYDDNTGLYRQRGVGLHARAGCVYFTADFKKAVEARGHGGSVPVIQEVPKLVPGSRPLYPLYITPSVACNGDSVTLEAKTFLILPPIVEVNHIKALAA